jgi:pimeloyl-ACP methyl ester carboxylesterase
VYSPSLYTAFVRDFARDRTDDAVCVASSLTGSYAVDAQREAGPFSRLALVCPTAETGTRRIWLRTLFRSPVVGTGLFNGLVSRPALRYFSNYESVEDPSTITDEDVDYYWRTAHQPGAKYAPASFVSGFLDPDFDLAAALSGLDVPVTLVWGEEAPYPSLEEGRQLAAVADTRLVVIESARLLPHHEHPDLFLDSLDRELPALAGEEEV